MLDIEIIALGRLKESYLRDAVAEYSKRLSTMCSFKITELEPVRLKDNPSQSEIDKALDKEADEILKKVGSGKLVALCIEGKQVSSEGFCDFIKEQKMQGVSRLCFCIGSSCGLSDKVKNKAIFKMSVSKMTFPHQLFRVMLTEQIYRALSIEEGLKYHK